MMILLIELLCQPILSYCLLVAAYEHTSCQQSNKLYKVPISSLKGLYRKDVYLANGLRVKA